MILAFKRGKSDPGCWVVCVIPSLPGTTSCLCSLYFASLLLFSFCQQCLFWWALIATKTRANQVAQICWICGVSCMRLHTCALHLKPRFPSFVCMWFGPHLEAEWRWRKRKKPEAESEEGGVNRFSRYKRPNPGLSPLFLTRMRVAIRFLLFKRVPALLMTHLCHVDWVCVIGVPCVFVSQS